MKALGSWRRLLQEGSLYLLLVLLPFSKAAVEILFGFLLLGWVLERLDPRTRRDTLWLKPALRPLGLALAGYLGICALSITVSRFPEVSVRAFFSKWLEYLWFFVIATDLGGRPAVLRRSLGALACSAFLVLVEGLSQEWLGHGLFRGYALHTFLRMTGPYENPIDLATYL
ncbi:MAG: hypothetical protein HYY91_00490, partial [Candidatus Omnitrophica bacterium]|nr:hypothetical protein [Candidatus Omnitrophota bacterium]